MRFKGSLVAPLLLVGLAVAPALQAAPGRKCESLTTLKLPHATIVSAKTVAAGPTTMTTFRRAREARRASPMRGARSQPAVIGFRNRLRALAAADGLEWQVSAER